MLNRRQPSLLSRWPAGSVTWVTSAKSSWRLSAKRLPPFVGAVDPLN